VTAVCGPPGSGKTTYVATRRKLGDLVWDFDAVMFAVCGDFARKIPGALSMGISLRNAFVRVIRDDAFVTPFEGQVWIIQGGATRKERRALASDLRAEIVMLMTPKEECLRRAAARGDTGNQGILKWFHDFEPDTP